MLIQPCKRDCPNRSGECRRTCDAWKAYEAERAADYERRRRRGEASNAVNMLEVKRYRKGKRK